MSNDKTFTREHLNKFCDDKNVKPFEDYQPVWVTMDSVKSSIQPWFWPGIIPDNTITLFAGSGGIGKSLLLLYIAAMTTTGEKFKACGIECSLPQGSVILLSAEDEPDYQIKPKLLAANADCSKIHYIKAKIGSISEKKRFLELDKDIYLLEQKIKELQDVRLIIIDPVAYFIGDIKDHYNSDVANFLQSLIDLARKYGVAILLNKHLRKQATGAKGLMAATNEVGGAGAWTNTPRKCWLIANDPDDPTIKIIVKLKDNLSGEDTNSLAYKITNSAIIDGENNLETTKLEWLSKMVKITADEAVNKTKKEQAVDFIWDYLEKNGQSLLKNIREAANKDGISNKTFDYAVSTFKDHPRIRVTRGIKNNKMWELIDE